MFIWQKNQSQHIMQQRENLPHALLLRGRAGIGKHAFALELAQTLLCSAPNLNAQTEQACGVCPSCVWFKEGGHPDFRLISPEEADESEDAPKKKASKKTQIAVEQIRQLIDYLSLSSHQVNSKRVILISPAETLNSASANALLKVLEEPPANTLFLLVASQPQRLLPTILSRCQVIDMLLPARNDALSWLASQGVKNAENTLDYAGGSPLLALQMYEEGELSANLVKNLALGAKLEPFTCAPLFLSVGMERAIETLQKWVFDLLAYRFSYTMRYHAQQGSALQALCKSVNLRSLINFQDKLLEAKKTAYHPLSNEVQLENILLQYTQLFKPLTKEK
jgi:DNA polymerase III subunit delta'